MNTKMTSQEHNKNLERFCGVAKLHNLMINEKKSINSTKSIDFLSYTITHASLRPNVERFRSLNELPVPKDKTTLHRIVGLFS